MSKSIISGAEKIMLRKVTDSIRLNIKSSLEESALSFLDPMEIEKIADMTASAFVVVYKEVTNGE